MKDHHTTKMAAPELSDADELAKQIEVRAREVHRLSQLVKLASFAAEARRTLEAISNASVLDQQLANELMQCVDAVNNWGTFDDVSGEVLRDIGSALERLANDVEAIATKARGFGPRMTVTA